MKWLNKRKWWLLNIALVVVIISMVSVTPKSESDGKPIITLGSIAEAAGSVDYTFDGTNDNVEVLAALNALPATGGRIVIVSAVTLNWAALTTVTRAIDNVVIEGAGRGTFFDGDGATAIFTAGGNNWQFTNLRVDAGNITMGATTGWMWTNVWANTTFYALRSEDAIDAVSFSIPTGRTATVVVASNDASTNAKAQADYVWDGTGDAMAEVIQPAINAIAAIGVPRGTLDLQGTNFDIATGGTGIDNLIINGNGVTWTATAALDPMFVLASKSNVRINGLTFDGDGTGRTGFVIAASAVDGSTNITIDDSTFTGFRLRNAWIWDNGNTGIRNSNITMMNSIVGARGNPDGAFSELPSMDIGQSDDVTIYNTLFEGDVTQVGSSVGLLVWSDPAQAGTQCVNVKVLYSTFKDWYNLHTVQGVFTTDFQLKNSTFTNCLNTGSTVAMDDGASTGFSITDNYFSAVGPTTDAAIGLGDTGIAISGEFSRNRLYSTRAGGLSLSGSGVIYAHDNQFNVINTENKAWHEGGFVGLIDGREGTFDYRRNITSTISGAQTIPFRIDAGGAAAGASIYLYDNVFNRTGDFFGSNHASLGNVNNAQLSAILPNFTVDYVLQNNFYRTTASTVRYPLMDISYTVAQGGSYTSSGSLTAGNANAIAFSWHNPTVGDNFTVKIVIEITTGGGTVGSQLDVGIADDAAGTNRGTEFFDDLLLNDADINDSWVAGDGGTQTKWVTVQDVASATDDWIVGQILTQNAASLVGKYYIEYVGK